VGHPSASATWDHLAAWGLRAEDHQVELGHLRALRRLAALGHLLALGLQLVWLVRARRRLPASCRTSVGDQIFLALS